MIDGPSYCHNEELLLRDSLDGLRLGLLLSKIAQTVDTLIILACITGAGSEDEEDKNDDILACIVSSLPSLVVLDLACADDADRGRSLTRPADLCCAKEPTLFTLINVGPLMPRRVRHFVHFTSEGTLMSRRVRFYIFRHVVEKSILPH